MEQTGAKSKVRSGSDPGQPAAGGLEPLIERPVTRIRPPGERPPLDLRELWDYREVVFFFLWRQLKVDYRQMALGPLWLVLKPALHALIYTLIFGVLAKLPSDELPYPLFTFSALVMWTFFTEAVKSSAGSLVAYRMIMEKVYFPRLILLIVSVLSSLINFVIALTLLFPMMAYYGYYPGVEALLLPVYAVLTGMIGLAVGVWTAPWVVHYRDVNHILDYMLLGWMYVTPVVYAIEVIPTDWVWLYRLNPMVSVVQGLRWALLGVGDAPDLALLAGFLVTLPILILGLFQFRRAERSIVDVA